MFWKRNNTIVLFLALALVMSACATTGQKLNQKQQVTIWNDMYNAQYDDTMFLMTNPSSTESQKNIGRQKKAILIQVWPMLKIYADVVDKGGVPDEKTVNDITSLMNQLAALAGGGKH